VCLLRGTSLVFLLKRLKFWPRRVVLWLKCCCLFLTAESRFWWRVGACGFVVYKVVRGQVSLPVGLRRFSSVSVITLTFHTCLCSSVDNERTRRNIVIDASLNFTKISPLNLVCFCTVYLQVAVCMKLNRIAFWQTACLKTPWLWHRIHVCIYFIKVCSLHLNIVDIFHVKRDILKVISCLCMS
jgi:hypothetical protein